MNNFSLIEMLGIWALKFIKARRGFREIGTCLITIVFTDTINGLLHLPNSADLCVDQSTRARLSMSLVNSC